MSEHLFECRRSFLGRLQAVTVGFVRNTVCALSQLELAPDARESWVLKTMRTVGNAVEAVTKHQAASQAV